MLWPRAGLHLCLALALLSPSAGSASFEPISFGEIWKDWKDVSRDAYLWGFTDGAWTAHFAAAEAWLGSLDAALKEPNSTKAKKATEKFLLEFPLRAIRDVMTSLYADPANQYIPFEVMAVLARAKLAGEALEPKLEAARRQAHETNSVLRSLQRTSP
jgi:hypothetical protein